MHRGIAVVATLLVLASVAPATGMAQSEENCSYPVERTDATGTLVEVTEEPNTVVTLNPSAAQTMLEIGAWEKMVGATKYASNLDGFDEIENISGAGQTISNEEVVGLEPDLVLAPNTIQNDTVRTLRGTGLTIYRFHEAKSIADIRDKTRLIGRFVGECDGAAETVSWMDERLAVVDAATDGAERPSAMYAFFGFTAGSNTFINTLIERAGAENAAATAGIESYKQINEEILVSQQIDWLILNTDWTEVPKTAGYNATTAVQEDQVVVVNTNHLNRPAPRVVYAVEKMAKAFYPDAYAAANSTETPPPTTESPATTAPPDTTTPGADGPGFTPVVAMLALLTVTLLARGKR